MAELNKKVRFNLTQEEQRHFGAVFNKMYDLINMVEDGSKARAELEACTQTIAKIVACGDFEQ